MINNQLASVTETAAAAAEAVVPVPTAVDVVTFLLAAETAEAAYEAAKLAVIETGDADADAFEAACVAVYRATEGGVLATAIVAEAKATGLKGYSGGRVSNLRRVGQVLALPGELAAGQTSRRLMALMIKVIMIDGERFKVYPTGAEVAAVLKDATDRAAAYRAIVAIVRANEEAAREAAEGKREAAEDADAAEDAAEGEDAAEAPVTPTSALAEQILALAEEIGKRGPVTAETAATLDRAVAMINGLARA